MDKEERTKMFESLKTERCLRCKALHIIIDPDDENERLVSCECEKCGYQWKLLYEVRADGKKKFYKTQN